MRHPVDVHVGTKIRQRRWVLGVTQQKLGEQVGIKFQQIQKYETGMNRVSASRLWDIAGVLEVPIQYFFEGLTREGASAADEENDVVEVGDRDTAALIRHFRQIPEKQRKKLLDLARTLSSDD